MTKQLISEELANKIYDLLVSIGGASEMDRYSFVYEFSKNDKEDCSEWRFCGCFGLGGKYRPKINRVTYYSEDTTKKREKRLKLLDAALSELDFELGLEGDVS